MAARSRVCSECPNRLLDEDGNPKPSGTKTCSKSCRQKRSRRMAAQKKRAGQQSPHAVPVQPLREAVAGEVKDAIHSTAVEELRPLVREAMTDNVLDAIKTMVGLTPRAIEVLEEQMASTDETIAQRAATLFLKYTMGNPSVAPPPSEKAPTPMSVTFNIPRPGDTTPPGPAQQHGDPVELRECGDCSQHKPDDEFVSGSDRCQACFDELQQDIVARFAKADDTRPA